MANEIKYFSMFTGVGGFEKGFAAASDSKSVQQPKDSPGKRCKETHCQSEAVLHRRYSSSLCNRSYKCVGFSETDKYACQVLRHRFPTVKNFEDATKIKPEELPDFDLLCGGFPCQAFSIAGKRKGFKDTRGTLFFAIARILAVKRPKVVLLENVKGLLNHEKGDTFTVILQTLHELGYTVGWMVLNSKLFGVPQNRERVFLVGSLGGLPGCEILPFKACHSSIDAMEQQVSSTLHSGYYKQGGRDQQYIPECRQLPETKGNSEGLRVYSQQGIGKSLTGSHSGLYQDKMKIRRLTPIECERLQGFPDDWTKYGIDEKGKTVVLSDTQRYKQMGNAVTVNVIQAIGEKLIAYFQNKYQTNTIT